MFRHALLALTLTMMSGLAATADTIGPAGIDRVVRALRIRPRRRLSRHSNGRRWTSRLLTPTEVTSPTCVAP